MKERIKIAWYGKHFGEEPPVSGSRGPASPNKSGLVSPTGGSGTIFFCHCNLKCVYCQNWQISQGAGGGFREYRGDEVVEIMLKLQEQRANNINLVSPTVWFFWLKEILKKAKKNGLKVPVVWNSNGYENVRVLGEFERLVDIYLPDFKYSNEKLAIKYSSAKNYPKIAEEAILEMQRQVGDLKKDKNGIAKKGLIVRHLVLPGHLEDTKKCLEFIRSISPNIHLSLMSQYNPVYKAKYFPEINRTLKREEYKEVLKMVRDLDFKDGWIQEFGDSTKCLNPNFSKENPFSY